MSKHYYFNLFESLINEENWREIAKNSEESEKSARNQRNQAQKSFFTKNYKKYSGRDLEDAGAGEAAGKSDPSGGKPFEHGGLDFTRKGTKEDADFFLGRTSIKNSNRDPREVEAMYSAYPNDRAPRSSEVTRMRQRGTKNPNLQNARFQAGQKFALHGFRAGDKAEDTRFRRLQKVKDRSSFGGTLKRGLAKLAGKFGFGRYGSAGGAKANLGEARKLKALFEAALLNRLQG
jgi:hypothetical protein